MADVWTTRARERPSVVVCMATYNPPIELFERQVESLRSQTCDRWRCVISDDASDERAFEGLNAVVDGDSRFAVIRAAENAGYYRNFERALIEGQRTGADLVALCDQDDWWHPEKLERLLVALEPGIGLAFSDMRIVDAELNVRYGTYWAGRKNNVDDLAALFFANTVTGAASLFRSSLLRYVLPFPDPVGASFHDHWIALVARTVSGIAYVDSPLHDYVQHDGNVIGHATRSVRRRSPLQRLRDLPADLDVVYERDLLRIQQFANALLLRAGEEIRPGDREVVAALSRLSSPRAAGWLAMQAVASVAREGVTMGSERRLLAALLWRSVSRLALPGRT